MGMDLIWIGVTLILATQIGLITPPVGLNIFAVKGIAGPGVELADLFRAAFPFLIAMVIALFFVIAFPGISTWIPYHMMGR
jgi:TRAP-type C4-dicarboxylate transport system permease large subunit